MKKCALLTCNDLTGFVTDEHHLEKALSAAGWQYDWISWDKKEVKWDEYDFAIVRTTWDYARRKTEFIESLKRIEKSSCQLLNPLKLIEWNIDKIYLKKLSEQGISVVPTLWLSFRNINDIKQTFVTLDVERIVVKPRVGAGAADTFLLTQDDLIKKEKQLATILNRDLMIQPFMEQVSQIGEYSVHYFAGELSHAILKKPKAGDFRSQEEFGSQIALIELNEKQKIFCEKVVNQIQEPWLYARVDFIYNSLLEENLIELELIEPSLYFRYKEGSAELLVSQLNSF